jgi:hypothetical protein
MVKVVVDVKDLLKALDIQVEKNDDIDHARILIIARTRTRAPARKGMIGQNTENIRMTRKKKRKIEGQAKI